MKVCHACDWSADGATERERSRSAVEHFVETGHAIDSSDSVGRPTPPEIRETLLVRDLEGTAGRSD